MKLKFKNVFFTVVLVLFSSIIVQGKTPEVYVNSEKVVFPDTQPVIIGGRVLVPIRGVFESIGATIQWTNESQLVHIEVNNTIIELIIDVDHLTYKKSNDNDFSVLPLDVPPTIYNGRTLIPIGAIFEVLDAQTDWDDNTKTAYIKFFDVGYSNELIPGNTITPPTLENGNKSITVGMSYEEFNISFGEADRAFVDNDFLYLTYINNYSNYLLVGFSNNKLMHIITTEDVNMKNQGASNLIKIVDENGNQMFTEILAGTLDIYTRNNPNLIKETELQVLDMTNALRVKRGTSPLKYNSKISAIAKEHSKDMAVNNYFSHVNLKGENFYHRLENSGIGYSYCGENIAVGYESPLDVVNGWLHSKGHRENLLLPEFEELGVGNYLSNDGSMYFSQNFYTGR